METLWITSADVYSILSTQQFLDQVEPRLEGQLFVTMGDKLGVERKGDKQS